MNFPWAGELHTRVGREAAQQDRPVGCTLRRAALFSSTPRPFPEPAGPPFCAVRRPALLSSVQPAESSRLSFGNTTLEPTSLPISVIPFQEVW